MFEILLLVSHWPVTACDILSTTGKNAALAQVVTPSWPHATSAAPDAAAEDPVSLPEAVSTISGDVPPFPAILNSKGCQNAAKALSLLSASGPDLLRGTPIDSSNDPRDLSPVTDEVAALLDRWERAAPQAPRQMTFTRTTYDLAREVETRAKGAFVYQSADCGGFRFRSDTSAEQPSARKNAQGSPFLVETDLDQSWSWSKDKILHIDKAAKTYSITPLSEAMTGFFRQAVHQYAPFIIDVRSDVIRREWSLSLIKQDNVNVFLEAVPRTAARKQQFSKCLLCLNAKSAQLTAIKYIDASQTQETVYVLDASRPLPKPPIDRSKMDCGPWGLNELRRVQLVPVE